MERSNPAENIKGHSSDVDKPTMQGKKKKKKNRPTTHSRPAPCIQMGSDGSHFAVSFFVEGKLLGGDHKPSKATSCFTFLMLLGP